uniref:Uncharacterized protein n=1 Tax=Lactuca sativa TaxID=4236 RepID=A0A9R1UDI9_LACSA|nr:hypothetical protein LSAT_V11C900488490 [Lactuca sativa]
MVGAKDFAMNQKLVDYLLYGRYRSITWFPCASQCPNLVLKDVSKLDNLEMIIKTQLLRILCSYVCLCMCDSDEKATVSYVY